MFCGEFFIAVISGETHAMRLYENMAPFCRAGLLPAHCVCKMMGCLCRSAGALVLDVSLTPD